MNTLQKMLPELNPNQLAWLERYIAEKVIGADEEVPDMEKYVESRGGAFNIDDDDNPAIATEAQNDLRATQRKALASITRGDV